MLDYQRVVGNHRLGHVLSEIGRFDQGANLMVSLGRVCEDYAAELKPKTFWRRDGCWTPGIWTGEGESPQKIHGALRRKNDFLGVKWLVKVAW